MPTPKPADNVIVTGTIGSHSYGTATKDSDYDYMSVVIPPADVYLGLKNWGNSGTMEHGFDDPEKGFVEHKYYELKKFIGMCAGMNPNAIPLLWLDPQHYEKLSIEGNLLVTNRHLFNSKKAFNTFSGYAHGQLHKMGGIFNDHEEDERLLRGGYITFQAWAEKEIANERKLRDLKDTGVELSRMQYDQGYLAALLKLNAHAKEEAKRIKDGPVTGRMGAKRKEIREQYGYDTKFLFHAVRLMTMCVEFLTNPSEGLKVYRKGIDAEFLYSIRMGALSQEQGKALCDELLVKAKDAVKVSDLPDEPDTERIHNLTMDMMRMSMDRSR